MVVDLDIKPQDVDRIIEMAWEDRTPFDAIELQIWIERKWCSKNYESAFKKKLF